MKKLLLLLGGLASSVLPSAAIDVYKVNPTGIKTAEELVPGDYLIYIIPDGTSKKPGYVYYDETGKGGTPARHYLSYPLDVTSGKVSDLNYIWTVSKDDNNNFSVTLTNDNTKYWIDDVQWGKNMTSSTNKTVLIAENSDDSEGIYFKPAEEMYTDDGTTAATNTYLNCNGPVDTYYTSLSYWGGENGKANAAKFIFYPVTKTVQKYPFELSDAPSNGQFAENTHWYYLTLRDMYATYYENQDQIPLTETNPISYGSFWAFVEKSDGVIEIYNAATGPDKVLASDAPQVNGTTGGNETHPIPVSSTELNGKTGAWAIKNGDGVFYLKREGQTEDYYLNERDGYLAFWSNSSSASDAGSAFEVQEINVENTIATVKANQEAITGAVGALTSEDYNNFKAALEQNTVEGLTEALKIRDLTGTRVNLEDTKYYRLKNAQRSGFLGLSEDNQSLKCATELNDQDANLLWKITKNEDNTVNLFHANAQLNADAVQNSNGTGLSIGLSADGADYTLKEWSATQFGFNIDGHYLVESNDNGNMGSWNEGGIDSDHAWYIIQAEDIDVNITAAGYATVNYPFAVQVPSEVTAYTGTADADKTVFTLNKIEDGIIPANTPVVLEGAEGTHILTILADNTTPALESGLKGTLLSETIEGTTNAYILGQKEESKPGFYQMDGTDRTLAANKAYLVLPQEASAVRSIIFSDGTTTGIESTVAEGAEAEEYYDLQGRRVMNPTKGIYVTKSGKKVLINK